MKATIAHYPKGMTQTVSMETLTECIKQGKYRNLVEKYRLWLDVRQHLPRPKYIDRIPLFCLSETDTDGKLVKYNGLVHLYLRKLRSQEEVEKLRALVNASERTFLSYQGTSLFSLHFVCRYALVQEDADAPELPLSEENARLFHAYAYNEARKYYQKLLRQPVHFQPSTPTDWHRMSSDEHLYYNAHAVCTRLEQPLALPDALPDYAASLDENPDPIQSLRPGHRRDLILSDLFDNCLTETLEELPRPDRDGDLHAFLPALASRCYRSGIPEADCVKWTLPTLHLHHREASVSKLIHNQYGVEKGGFGNRPCIGKEQKLAWQLKDFVSRHYELRFNELKQCAEYVNLHSQHTDFQTVDERVINDICYTANEQGIPAWDKDVRRLIGSHYVRPFNPLLDYVVSTPRWDGEDHIGNLARRIPTSHRHWHTLFRRWFLSLVAHWIGMDREHANSVTPQLLGGPGERKSTFCRMILPTKLREYYTDHLNLSSLRSATRMLGRFALINIDEFDQIPASKQAFLKNFLQMPDVKDNAPYQSQVKTFRRYASFIATSNMRDVLTDPSGSRRYLCVEVTGQIDTSPVDYPQLYAQAYRLLRNGEQYWFTKEEEEIIRLENARFQHEPDEEQLFCSLFRAAREDEPCEELRGAELLIEIERRYGIKFGKKTRDTFSRRLTKLRIPSVHRMTGNFYRVVRLSKNL